MCIILRCGTSIGSNIPFVKERPKYRYAQKLLVCIDVVSNILGRFDDFFFGLRGVYHGVVA